MKVKPEKSLSISPVKCVLSVKKFCIDGKAMATRCPTLCSVNQKLILDELGVGEDKVKWMALVLIVYCVATIVVVQLFNAIN